MSLNPEQKARQQIDAQLVASGWIVQDKRELNFHAGPGLAVREYPTDTGPADYVLFVDQQAVGVIEAKKPVCGKEEQEIIVSTLATQLSALDVVEADIDANLQKAEALRQAILKKAFAGELVPQDPAAEPASALLARLRGARAATPAAPRRGRKSAGV